MTTLSRVTAVPAESAPLVSVVVPVFNSPCLPELVRRIHVTLNSTACTHEIVLVDDGSPDPAVWPTILQLISEYPQLKAIRLTRNFGQQPATLCGLAEASGDLLITIDDDLQQRPEDIVALLEHGSHDVVLGQYYRRHHSPWRRAASRLKGTLDERLLGRPPGLLFSSFRLLRRPVAEAILSLRTSYPFLPALMLHVTRDMVGVPVSHDPRKAGASGYTVRKQLSLLSNLLLSNSVLLLKGIGYLGVLSGAASVLLIGVLTYRRLTQQVSVPGWASLMAVQLFTAGSLLLGFGLLGEYLLRIIHGTENRPAYFVRTRVTHSSVAEPPFSSEPRYRSTAPSTSTASHR
jgi:glycosyltransferase involved in cell wall biosynthesis